MFSLDGGHDGFYTEMMEAPGIAGFFWDGMTLDGPSLRGIDSLVE